MTSRNQSFRAAFGHIDSDLICNTCHGHSLRSDEGCAACVGTGKQISSGSPCLGHLTKSDEWTVSVSGRNSEGYVFHLNYHPGTKQWRTSIGSEADGSTGRFSDRTSAWMVMNALKKGEKPGMEIFGALDVEVEKVQSEPASSLSLDWLDLGTSPVLS